MADYEYCICEIDKAGYRLRFLATSNNLVRVECDYGIGYSVIAVFGAVDTIRVASKLLSFAAHRNVLDKLLVVEQEAANGVDD